MVHQNTIIIEQNDILEKHMHVSAEKALNSDCDTASVRSGSYDSQGNVSSTNSSEAVTDNEKEEPRKKKLISKPIVDGKTFTTILYEVIAGLDTPTTISYFQVDAEQPRTRNGRFVIECHLNGKSYGTGEGSSKKAAKQLASELALNKLLKELPAIGEDISRVRNGFPSRKKIRSRRRRVAKPERRQWRPSAPIHRPCSSPLLDMQEQRMLELEFAMMNKMVENIKSYTNYLGYDGMTPYETALLFEDNMFLMDDDSYDEFRPAQFLPPVPPHPFDRDLPIDNEMVEPNTLEFMRKMRARSGLRHTDLSANATEFKPMMSSEESMQTQV